MFDHEQRELHHQCVTLCPSNHHKGVAMKRIFTLIAIAMMSTGVLAQGTGRGAAQGARGAAPAPAMSKALVTLQGTWTVNTINGQAPGPLSLAFKGDKYEQTFQGAVNERGTIKVDGTK